MPQQLWGFATLSRLLLKASGPHVSPLRGCIHLRAERDPGAGAPGYKLPSLRDWRYDSICQKRCILPSLRDWHKGGLCLWCYKRPSRRDWGNGGLCLRC